MADDEFKVSRNRVYVFMCSKQEASSSGVGFLCGRVKFWNLRVNGFKNPTLQKPKRESKFMLLIKILKPSPEGVSKTNPIKTQAKIKLYVAD